METTQKTLFRELTDAIKYMIESCRGRYSLDSYLSVVEKYTDQIILNSVQNDNLTFSGGLCEVGLDVNPEKYLFDIKLYFKTEDGANIVKEASRSLPKNKFTSETQEILSEKKIFEISSPN